MSGPLRQDGGDPARPDRGGVDTVRSGRRRRWPWAALGLLSLLAAPPAGLAQDRPPPRTPSEQPAAPMAQKVSIEVMVVHATNGHDKVDGRLQPMMQHLRFLNYSGFDVLDTSTQALAMDQEASFDIVGDRQVKVQLLERDDEAAKIRVRMFNKNGKLLDTTVSIHRNRSFMVAGPRHGDGVLILPVTARY